MRLLVVVIAALCSCTCYAQGDPVLPDEWTNDFKITVYSNGGKREVETKITFTHDACLYAVRKDSQKKTAVYKLTDSERTEILAKLHELSADKVRSEKANGMVKTRASAGYCLYGKHPLCAEESAASLINEDDKTNFHLIYQYLIGFAAQKRM